MSRAPSSLTGGIIWKNIAGHQRIAILSKKDGENGWHLPVVKQDPYHLTKSDPFAEIGKMAGTEVKNPVSAETLFYPDFDPPEYAIFWHLQVKANAKQFTPQGNHIVKWVTPLEATQLLSHQAEKT